MAITPTARFRLVGSRLVAAPLLAAALAVSAPAAAQAPAGDKPEVTMAIPALSLAFSMSYVADDLDLWGKHGIRVKSTLIRGVGALNAVISGSADFTQSSGTSFTRAVARGQKLLAIASTLDRPIIQLVVRKDLAAGFDPKATLAQRAQILKGKTIAVDGVNSIVHAYVRLVARRGGMDPETLKVTPMDATSMLAAMQNKQIDGFGMTLPWAVKPVLDGAAVLVASGPDGDPGDLNPFSHELVITKPETCEKRKGVCEAVGRAVAEAVAYIRNNPKEAQAIIKKRFPNLDDSVMASAFESIRKITPVPPIVQRVHLENAEKYNIDAGLLKPEESLKSFDGLYTDRYVK